MDNLFLEILRVIDYKYNDKNTDFYLFPLNYYKLVISEKKITKEMLTKIVEKIFIGNEYLFLASKIEHNIELLEKVKIDPNKKGFTTSRNIVFFICYFLKYLVNLNNDEIDMSVERLFFNVNDTLISSFNYILNHSINNDPIINIYNDIDKFSEENKILIKSIFGDGDFNLIKSSFKTDISYNITYNFCHGLMLYIDNNKLNIGIKKSFDYNFDVCIFYIIFSLLSNNINEINLGNIYKNIN